MMRLRPSLIHGVAAVLVAIFMMVPTVAPPRSTAAQEASSAEVRIVDFGFNPVILRISAGTTVTWTNVGAQLHTVTAGGGSFASGRLDPGEQYTHTFTEAGTFDYFCEFHPDTMKASVVVTADDSTSPADATEAVEGSAPQDVDAAVAGSLLATAQQGGLVAAVHDGDCAQIGPEVAALTTAFVPSGEKLGHPRSLPVANSFSTIPVALDAMLAADHAIVVTGPDGSPLTCGNVGGFLTENGALIIGLRSVDSTGLDGTVYLSSADDPAQTTVSLFLTGEALRDTADNDGAPANMATEPAEAIEATVAPTVPAPAQEPIPTAAPQPERELTLDYLQPAERSGPYAGFAVRFTNNIDGEILNPQTEVIVELGGYDWNCQGYGDPISGAAVTGVMDVLGMPLVLSAGEEVPVVIYCRIPEAPLDSARLRLR